MAASRDTPASSAFLQKLRRRSWKSRLRTPAFAKWFQRGEHVKLETLMEFFNLLSRGNPSSIQSTADGPVPFGTVTQVLPGREGQVGIKIEF